MVVRLKPTADRVYRGTLNYLVAYDHSAGHPDRYTVLALNSGDPVTIGRELDLRTVRELIADYELEAKKLPCYIGERKDILLCMERIIRKRRHS